MGVKVSSYRFKSRKKSLGLPWGLEPTHAPFSNPCRSMRVLHPVVQSLMLSVVYSFENLFLGCSITLQFVCDNHSWYSVLGLEKFAEKLLSSPLVTTALHQNIDDLAILIDGSP